MFLITGASGFLGKSLVKSFKNKPVAVLLRKNPDRRQSWGKNVSIRYGDIADSASLVNSFKNITGVIHTAATIHSSKPDLFYQTNVVGTQNIINECIKNNIKRLIFISSLGVKINDKSAYELSKEKAESLVKQSPLQWTIIRPGIIYGPNDNKNISRLINYAYKLPLFPCLGDGNFLTQPVYIDDVTKFIILILSKSLSYQKTYELGGKYPLSFDQTIKTIIKTSHKNQTVIHLPLSIPQFFLPLIKLFFPSLAPSVEGLIRQTQGIISDNSQAKTDFQYNPLTFNQGIEKTLLHFK